MLRRVAILRYLALSRFAGKAVLTYLTLLVIMASVCAAADKVKWIEVRSIHFNLVTNGDEKHAREVALHLEELRAFFGQVLNRSELNQPIPLQVVALRSADEMQRLEAGSDSKLGGEPGFFQASSDRDYMVLDLSAPDPWKSVLHNFAHSLLNGNYPQTPLWFDEGLADYFSTVGVGNKDITAGKPPEGAMELLQSGTWIPLPDLMSVSRASKEFNEADRHSMFYSESWLTFDYLFTTGQMSEAGKFFALTMDQHSTVEDALKQAFSMDAKQFDEALHQFAHSPKNQAQSRPLPLELEQMRTYSVEPVTTINAQAMVADVQVHSASGLDAGTGELENLLKQASDNAAVHSSLGFAELQKKDYDKATEQLARAFELDPKNPWPRYYTALLNYQQNGLKEISGHDAIEMGGDLSAAIQAYPQFADAYNLRGLAELANGDTRQALRDLSEAALLSPRNETYLANLGRAYAAGRMWTDAQTVFHRLEKSSDPETAKAASFELSHIDQLEHSKPAPSIMGRSAEDYTAPQWRPKKKQGAATGASTPAEHDNADEKESAKNTKADVAPTSNEVKFLQGTLQRVDCSSPPAAKLTIVSGTKTWIITTADYKQTVVIGADEFSCVWQNRKVSVNYQPSGKRTGRLVSLELE